MTFHISVLHSADVLCGLKRKKEGKKETKNPDTDLKGKLAKTFAENVTNRKSAKGKHGEAALETAGRVAGKHQCSALPTTKGRKNHVFIYQRCKIKQTDKQKTQKDIYITT